ncbi:uncharacterized protein SCHCODRAFT_02623850 [Schizophyllum commune H4-8]|uniref:uncharacterized protein n=1 Tax=Schizophyllum commune (strain H4-8 / FGSC 9210) TaxID=578458 RepID=UPI00215F10AF|nr:uncharacterized protein SCHCODRAFT_02623850 [Schizophyllum commune H4-8]KAI5894143.1 hypothetical protein SCHCODRAFT_02623850 [Schizophyllum commune H4-8]
MGRGSVTAAAVSLSPPPDCESASPVGNVTSSVRRFRFFARNASIRGTSGSGDDNGVRGDSSRPCCAPTSGLLVRLFDASTTTVCAFGGYSPLNSSSTYS